MSYVNFETFDQSKLTITQPERKSIPTKPGEQPIPDYWSIPYVYNYGTEEEPDYQDFKLEFDEVRSPYGISDKFKKWTIGLYLDPSKYQKAIDVLDLIYKRTAELLDGPIPSEWSGGKHDTLKMFIGKKYFDKNAPHGMFSHPAKEPKDGSNAKYNTFYFNLFSRGFGAKKCETVFTFGEENDERIDKSELVKVDMTYQPSVHFNGIFANANNITIQSELESAVIIDFDINNFEPKQVATIQKRKVEDPELTNRVSSKLAILRSHVVAAPSSTLTNNDNSNDTSLSGIAPTISSVLKNKNL